MRTQPGRPGGGMGRGGYESSVPVYRVSRVGNPGEKIPAGTRSRLWNAQRMLASKIPQQAPADSYVPSGIFSPSSPTGKITAGTEDRVGYQPFRPVGLRPLICSISSRRGNIVTATTIFQMPGYRLLYGLRVFFRDFVLDLSMGSILSFILKTASAFALQPTLILFYISSEMPSEYTVSQPSSGRDNTSLRIWRKRQSGSEDVGL